MPSTILTYVRKNGIYFFQHHKRHVFYCNVLHLRPTFPRRLKNGPAVHNKALCAQQEHLRAVCSRGLLFDMAALGVERTISHPDLKIVLSEDIIQFELDCNRYLLQIEEINHNWTPSTRVKPTSPKPCIAPELLSSLVLMNTFGGCDEVDDVNNNHILPRMNLRQHCSKENMARRVDTALSAAAFKTSRADPAGATIMFFTKMYTELKRHGAQAAIDHSSKALVNLIIPKLRPPIVRDMIKREHPYWKVETLRPSLFSKQGDRSFPGICEVCRKTPRR